MKINNHDRLKGAVNYLRAIDRTVLDVPDHEISTLDACVRLLERWLERWDAAGGKGSTAEAQIHDVISRLTADPAGAEFVSHSDPVGAYLRHRLMLLPGTWRDTKPYRVRLPEGKADYTSEIERMHEQAAPSPLVTITPWAVQTVVRGPWVLAFKVHVKSDAPFVLWCVKGCG